MIHVAVKILSELDAVHVVGAYEALFMKGRSRLVNFVNSKFDEFMLCVFCEAQLRIKKSDAARFFVDERVYCGECQNDQPFPLGWLLSKVDLDLFDR